jgi:ABC-2 type transport system permease protein
MGLRDRAFRRFAGETTPRRWRFLVLWRYGRREVFASRLVTALFALAFAPVLVFGVLFYLRHNAPVLAAMDITAADLIAVDADVFLLLLRIQAAFAFVLTALVGPGLVAPDLANNGLALYLARPFSRTEYVLGKMSVVVILTSAITWVPLLLLWLLQAGLEPGWAAGHLRVAAAAFLGSWVWIGFLALLALALSAWVRWRVVAAALLVVVIIVGASLGEMINAMLNTGWGRLLSPGMLVMTIWEGLFHGAGGPPLTVSNQVPLAAAWIALLAMCGVCLLVLDKKLAAYEVVR